MRKPNRQKAKIISRWFLYQKNSTSIEDERKNRMKYPNKDGATTVPAVMAPWAMKNRVGHPYTRCQNSINEMKATEQSPTVNTIRIIQLFLDLKVTVISSDVRVIFLFYFNPQFSFLQKSPKALSRQGFMPNLSLRKAVTDATIFTQNPLFTIASIRYYGPNL